MGPDQQLHSPWYPRWLTEPFLRESALRPEQTLLINEMGQNDIAAFTRTGGTHAGG